MKLSQRIREGKEKRAVVPPPAEKATRTAMFENWWALAARAITNGTRCEVTQ